MSLRVDLEQAIENLRSTTQSLREDIDELQKALNKHLGLVDKIVDKAPLPPRVMQNLERAVIGVQRPVGDGK